MKQMTTCIEHGKVLRQTWQQEGTRDIGRGVEPRLRERVPSLQCVWSRCFSARMPGRKLATNRPSRWERVAEDGYDRWERIGFSDSADGTEQDAGDPDAPCAEGDSGARDACCVPVVHGSYLRLHFAAGKDWLSGECPRRRFGLA